MTLHSRSLALKQRLRVTSKCPVGHQEILKSWHLASNFNYVKNFM